MDLPDGRIALDSDGFGVVLHAVDRFHDGSIGCATFLDPTEQTIFVEMMYFGVGLKYNPMPIIGGMFWFDLPVSGEVRELGNLYGREIGHVSVTRTGRIIEFQLQDQDYEKFRIEFGSLANFQFVTSRALSGTPLRRR